MKLTILLWLLPAAMALGCISVPQSINKTGRGIFTQHGPDPVYADAAAGNADALLSVQESAFWAIGNGAQQEAESTLGRKYNNPMEVLSLFAIWPLDPSGTPWPIVDPILSPNAPFPRVEVPSNGKPWEWLGIAAEGHRPNLTWFIDSAKSSYNDLDRSIHTGSADRSWRVANDLTWPYRDFIDAHQRLPNDPLEAFTWSRTGVVASEEQELLKAYDLEFLIDHTAQSMALVGTPKQPGLQIIEITYAVDPLAFSGKMHELPNPQVSAMKPWAKWDVLDTVPRLTDPAGPGTPTIVQDARVVSGTE